MPGHRLAYWRVSLFFSGSSEPFFLGPHLYVNLLSILWTDACFALAGEKKKRSASNKKKTIYRDASSVCCTMRVVVR